MGESSQKALVKVRAAPGARKSEVVGEYGDAIRIKVAAPPVDGKANEVLLDFVAEKAGVHRRDVVLVSGQASRDKTISIEGLDLATARARLLG